MTCRSTTVLADDAVLPQRDALLDTATMADRLSRLFDVRPSAVGRCERLRVNYQVGKSLRVLLRIDVEGTTQIVSARAFRTGRADRASQVLYDADLNTAFWVFPDDRKLVGLEAIIDGRVSASHDLPREWSSTCLKAYAPEKSATFGCLDDQGDLIGYAKVSATDQSERDFATYRALAASLDNSRYLRLPHALAFLPTHRLLLLEPIDGRRMNDATAPEGEQDATRFGAALAAFHGLNADALPPFARFSTERLQTAHAILACIRPDVRDDAEALANNLIARRPAEDEPSVCLHGDVHPKNGLVTDRQIALIDMEDVGRGPAAADIGSFLAALRYLRCGGHLRTSVHRAVSRAFLSGYAAVRPLPSAPILRWHTSASLLVERALRAITRVRPLGLLYLPELLRDARALLTDDHDA